MDRVGQLRGELPKPLRCMGLVHEHDTFIVGGLQSVVPYAAPLYYDESGLLHVNRR